ncbi:MAG TPA: methionine aminotransferase [Steroidobacteraceae bacterium]|nr:methionine aminotransferase [Steroidobacteraceae bacterium]
MRPPLESKLPAVGTTIFTVMSRLAAEHGAINLSQGFPDFEPPPRLVELVERAMRRGPRAQNQYAPMAGLPALREAIAAKVAEYYARKVDPETDVTVTSGGTEALFCAIQAVVQAGDEVLLLDPAYDSYEPAVVLAGGRAVHVPLRRPDFAVDWQRVREAVTPRTRLLVVNFPHNPSGAVLSHGDLDALAEVVRGTRAFLLADEVYEHMLFDGRVHHSLLGHEELAARSFVVSSFGKTYHATGWKVGYCIAPALLTVEFRKVHQFVQFAVATPLQVALAEFMVEAPEHARELPAFYQARRDHFARLLLTTRLRFEPAASTYFQLVDYSAVSDAPDTEFARDLTVRHGVAAIPISVFSAEPPPAERIVRFCFAKHEATLTAAAEKLRRL